MPSVYVASPLGFSEATSLYYESVLLVRLRAAGFEVLDPWQDDGGEVAAAIQASRSDADEARRIRKLREINESLGAANERMIRQAAAILAILDGVDVDSGTAAEIGYATGLGKPTVGLRLDGRLTGDNEAVVVNLQVEHFIRSCSGRVVRTLDDALSALDELRLSEST